MARENKTEKTFRNTKTGDDCCIMNGALYFSEARQFSIDSELFCETIEHESVKAIRVISLSTEWFEREWIGDGMYKNELSLEMTLRKEKRGNKNHWYAYRRFAGKLHKRYVGVSENVTGDRLVAVAQKIPALSNLKKLGNIS